MTDMNNDKKTAGAAPDPQAAPPASPKTATKRPAARPPLPARQARQARGHQHHPVYTSAFHGAKVTKGAGCAKWQTPRRHPAAPRTRIRTFRPACANLARRDGDFSQVSSPPGNSGTFSAVFTQKFWQNKKIYYFCNRKRKTKVP